MITAIIRFVEFQHADLFSDVSFKCVTTMIWTIIEPGMYQIAATLPTLRPVLKKTVTSLSSLSLLSRFSSTSRLQRTEHSSGNQDEARNNFVKLDDYHYMHNSKAGKGGAEYSGVMKTTDVSISSRPGTDD